MYFQHAPAIWRDFPALVPGALYAGGITANAAPDMDDYIAIAKARLADGPESEFPEIQAWRRAFARMGLKPTQYRCAAESLLRRFRKEGSLPRLHPLVDLCNAVSMAFAVPVAVLDAAQIAWPLEVRYAARTTGKPGRARPGVASVACHGGIRALSWLRAEPGANAHADHRLEPARRQTALYHEGCAGSRGPGSRPPGRRRAR